MRLIHAADIHLDSPLRGLDRIGEDAAALVRQATRHALENLVRLTIERTLGSSSSPAIFTTAMP